MNEERRAALEEARALRIIKEFKGWGWFHRRWNISDATLVRLAEKGLIEWVAWCG